MKILLTAINAKYIHSNLAVYSLKAYAQSFLDAETHVALAEYTINQQIDDILMDIYKQKPDMLCFSCYIWNITCVEAVVKEIHKVLPETRIWLGGPEVSYDAVDVLNRLQEAEGVIRGNLCPPGNRGTACVSCRYYLPESGRTGGGKSLAGSHGS